MSSFIENLSPKEWENFCEVMLRQHYGAKNFYPVPDQDGGDLGIEFYTADGTIFQCYYPEKELSGSFDTAWVRSSLCTRLRHSMLFR